MDLRKYGQQYAAPVDLDKFVDVEKGHVIGKDEIPPIEVIKALAARYKMQISDPSPGCHKCYGRGYISKDIATGAPIPCGCLFRGRDAKKQFADMQAGQVYGRWNRDQRRKMERSIKKSKKSKISDNLDQHRASISNNDSVSAAPVSVPIDIEPVDIFKSKEA